MNRLAVVFLSFWATAVLSQSIRASDSVLRADTAQALRRGVEFFRTKVAVEGTYVWQYSEDLSLREGENTTTATQGWVQPPGTPAVGAAFLDAFEATQDTYFLEAAKETASGLIRGQLQSGGWTYVIGFSKEDRRRFAYREGSDSKGRNVTTFDDDTTQSALRFLMRLDRALKFSDEKIHEAAEFCIQSLIKAQYPNGAWPQGYDRFPEAEKFPVKKAAYPESWPREWPGSGQYWLRYTLNDNNHAALIDTLIQATEIYKPSKHSDLVSACRGAIEKAGNFILLAQMPDPQPAWAQQYDFDMHPAWARKFEPPAISAGESQGIIRALFQLHRFTGEAKYLEPVPRALAYLRGSRLPDGRLARFYELRANKPLYFTREYQLTYDDGDLPTHYGFKISDNTDGLQKEYDGLKKSGPFEKPVRAPTATPELISQVKSILAAQDSQGRWVESGRLKTHPAGAATRIIRSATFNRNIETLARFLRATAPDPVRP